MNTTKILEIIKEEEKKYDFSDLIENYIDIEELAQCETSEEVAEYLEDLNSDNQITDTEVIYYHNAMEYLSEKDPSLQGSISLAIDYGYDLKDITSEKLATILQCEENKDDYNTFIHKVVARLDNE